MAGALSPSNLAVLMRVDDGVGPHFVSASNSDADRSSILIRLFFEVSPLTIETWLLETPKCLANSRTISAFAAPLTGGEQIRTFSEPSCSPTISLFEARGMTRTATITQLFCSEMFNDTLVNTELIRFRLL